MLASATLLAPLLWLHDPDLDSHPTLCLFRSLTGFPCPGCGITRSLVSIYRGDLQASLEYHLFGLPVLGFCVAVIAVSCVELITQRRLFRRLLFSTRLAWALAAVLMVYHGARLVHFVHTHSIDDILRDSVWR